MRSMSVFTRHYYTKTKTILNNIRLLNYYLFVVKMCDIKDVMLHDCKHPELIQITAINAIIDIIVYRSTSGTRKVN